MGPTNTKEKTKELTPPPGDGWVRASELRPKLLQRSNEQLAEKAALLTSSSGRLPRKHRCAPRTARGRVGP